MIPLAVHQELWVELKEIDPRGRVLQRVSQRANSRVIAYIQHIRCLANGANESGVVDITPTGRTIRYPTAGAGHFLNLQPASTNQVGIVVGTGATAVAVTDSGLQTIVGDGIGAGQLTHNAQTLNSVGGSGSSRQFTIVRSFTNSSGGAITITETGLYCQTTDSGGAARDFCIERTVLGSSFTVNDGNSATVTYTLKITV